MLNANTSIRGRWTRSYVKGQGVLSPPAGLDLPRPAPVPQPCPGLQGSKDRPEIHRPTAGRYSP